MDFWKQQLSDDWVRDMGNQAIIKEAHYTTHIEGTRLRGPRIKNNPSLLLEDLKKKSYNWLVTGSKLIETLSNYGQRYRIFFGSLRMEFLNVAEMVVGSIHVMDLSDVIIDQPFTTSWFRWLESKDLLGRRNLRYL